LTFINLHVHTEYSLLDGMSKIPQLVARAKELDQPALAITDHGLLSATPDFYKECRKQDVVPIIGQEFYIIDDVLSKDKDKPYYHLTVLAANTDGYHTLVELSSIAHKRENYFKKPRLDFNILEKFRPRLKDLICLTGCMAGHIAGAASRGKIKRAERYLKQYRYLFPNLYMELMYHHDKDNAAWNDLQSTTNYILQDLGRKYRTPIVITNDSHYVQESERDVHDLLLAIGTGAQWNEEKRFRLQGRGYHLRGEDLRPEWPRDTWSESERSMQDVWQQVKDFRIPILDEKKFYIPTFPRKDKTLSSYDYIVQRCEKKLKEIGLWNKTYRKRLAYEMEVIHRASFEEEFLIVRDYIRWADRRGIRVGAGRGSMAGVLVAFLLGITGIDPIKYRLLFERALNPARPSLPDFDVDFQASRREEVVQYIINKYGADNSMQVCTFGTMAPKGAVGAVLSALGVNWQERAKVTAVLPNVIEIVGERKKAELEDIWEDEAYITPELRSYAKQYPDLKPWSIALQGTIKNFGTHAAGVVISDKSMDIKKYVPTMLIARDTRTVTQFDMAGCKSFGFVKFDILGLTNLDTIAECIALIGVDPFESLENFEDQPTFDMMNRGELVTVFQMQGYACRECIQTMGVKSFEDIIAINALSRPGAMQFLGEYHQQRDHPKKVQYIDPRLEPILGMSNGVLLYQEQTMQIGLDIAGFDHIIIDDLKEAIKYKKSDVFKRLRVPFLEGCAKNGCTPDVAKGLWEMIRRASGYQFNRAHSVSYAVIAFQTAYLKCHYPLQWYAASLRTTETKSPDSKGKLEEIMQEATRSGIKFLPPDINKSGESYTIEGKNIRFGLISVKGVGNASAVELVAKRGQKDYNSLEDIFDRVERRRCSARVTNALESVGALESIGVDGDPNKYGRELTYLGVSIRNRIRKRYARRISKYLAQFSGALSSSKDEEVVIGGIISRATKKVTRLKEDGKGGGADYLVIRVDFPPYTWQVYVWPKQYEQYNKVLHNGNIVLIQGKRQVSRGGTIIFDDIQVLKERNVRVPEESNKRQTA